MYYQAILLQFLFCFLYDGRQNAHQSSRKNNHLNLHEELIEIINIDSKCRQSYYLSRVGLYLAAHHKDRAPQERACGVEKSKVKESAKLKVLWSLKSWLFSWFQQAGQRISTAFWGSHNSPSQSWGNDSILNGLNGTPTQIDPYAEDVFRIEVVRVLTVLIVVISWTIKTLDFSFGALFDLLHFKSHDLRYISKLT